MRVRYKAAFAGPDTEVGVGEIRDEEAAFAQRLIDGGYAEKVDKVIAKETAAISKASRAKPKTTRKKAKPRA